MGYVFGDSIEIEETKESYRNENFSMSFYPRIMLVFFANGAKNERKLGDPTLFLWNSRQVQQCSSYIVRFVFVYEQLFCQIDVAWQTRSEKKYP